MARFHIAQVVGFPGYQEVIDTLRWGFEALGHEVTASQNRFEAGRTNIVFGFHVLSKAALEEIPADSIVYNLEQLAGIAPNNIKPSLPFASQRFRVWEYSEFNLPAWDQFNPAMKVIHVPIGWSPVLARVPKVEEQDIDVLFYGSAGPTRLRVFQEITEMRLSCVWLYGLYGKARDDLISRAKLVLNVNNLGDIVKISRIFEVVRVSYLLANSKAVVADERPDTLIEPDLREAVALAPPEGIAAMCRSLVESRIARKQLERRGAAIMSKRDIRGILQRALES